MKAINGRKRTAWAAALIAPALILSGASASAATLDRVKQDKTLRLAVRADAPPFSSKNAAGDYVGFMVDLCRAVGQEIGGTLGADLKIEMVPVTAADRFQAIESGKADLLCEPTTETLTRREHLDFSIPTFIDGASLIALGDGPKEFGALAGQKVGVVSGTTTEQELRNTLKGAGVSAEVVTFTTHEQGLRALAAGQLAAYFGDRSIIGHVASTLPEADKFRLANSYLTVEPYALAMQHGDEAFRLAVDRALSHIYRSGLVARIFVAAFGPNNPPTETLKTLYAIAGLPD